MTNEKSIHTKNIERSRLILAIVVASAVMSFATVKAENPFSMEKKPNGFKTEFNPVKLFQRSEAQTNFVDMPRVTNGQSAVAISAPPPSAVVPPLSSATSRQMAAAVPTAEQVSAVNTAKCLACAGTGKCPACGGRGQVEKASNSAGNQPIVAETKKRQPIPEQRIGAELSDVLKQEILSSIQRRVNESWEQRERSWFSELRAATNGSWVPAEGLTHQLVERKGISWVVSPVMDPGDLGRLNGEAWKVVVRFQPSYMRIKNDDRPWGSWEVTAAFRRIVVTCVNGELVYTSFAAMTGENEDFERFKRRENYDENLAFVANKRVRFDGVYRCKEFRSQTWVVLRLFEDGTLTETYCSEGRDLRRESEKSSAAHQGRFFVDGDIMHAWTKTQVSTIERMGTIRETIPVLREIINGRSSTYEERFEFVPFSGKR